MNFICQQEAIKQLKDMASHNKHSILIEGPPGCGKTHLANMYANLLNVPDFQVVEPTVQALKDTVDSCCKIDTPVVICIENLDKGVLAASYAVLKFLEEPRSNVYIVVTCSNINKVPDTIVSRSVCIVTAPPIDSDIIQFASSLNFERYNELSKSRLWRCITTFKNVETILSLTPSQLDYFNSLGDMLQFRDSVSNMSWKLGHYPDNTETPIELVIRYMIELSNDSHVIKSGIDCIRDLTSNRIAPHAVIAKFLFDCKYCE